MLKIDLHTHSIGSPDGGISEEQYERLLSDGTLDFVAITDHNSIDFAQNMQTILGNKIIVGEEIMTQEGEIIGLFLKKAIAPGMSVEHAMHAVHQQGGLVYIPHPLEKIRKGLSLETIKNYQQLIDIVEVYNGRAVRQNRSMKAAVWARLEQKARAASSDAHSVRGVGSAYTIIKDEPTRENLVEQLVVARFVMNRPPLRTLLAPKTNKLGRIIKRHG